MSCALQSLHEGAFPVSHIWFSVTHALIALKKDNLSPLADHLNRWSNRVKATETALEYAQRALKVSKDEDIAWFVRCLEVGRRFAEVLRLLLMEKSGRDEENSRSLDQALVELGEYIGNSPATERTDILGGDPGCWMETVQVIRGISSGPTFGCR